MSASKNTHRVLLLASVLSLSACASVRVTEGPDFVKPVAVATDAAKPAPRLAPVTDAVATSTPVTRSAPSTVSMAPLAPLGGAAANPATAVTAAASATKPSAPAAGKVVARAAAELKSTKGSAAFGVVSFAQTTSDTVRISGAVQGLKPNTEHAFHVHEKGSCASADAMSAGGHFNPGNQAHGKPAAAVHHAGDLPNLKADAQGVATFDFSFPSKSFSIGAGSNDILGRSLIVHRDPDDFTSQPAGNAGPRIACGVISIG